MLKNFWVKNFLSIQDKQEINFEAKDEDVKSNFIFAVDKNTNLYKLNIFYGANACGKSNILKALETLFNLLTKVEISLPHTPCASSASDNTYMHMSFYIDKIQYVYDLEYNSKCIVKESLYYYPRKSKALFYTRSFESFNIQSKIKFGQSLHLSKKTQESITINTLHNHTILALFSTKIFSRDTHKIANLYNNILNLYSFDLSLEPLCILKNSLHDKKQELFFKTMLKQSSFNIENYRLTKKVDTDALNLQNLLANKDIDLKLNTITDSIEFIHKGTLNDFTLDLSKEPQSLLKYVVILNYLYALITKDKVYCIDDFDAKLDYDLLMYCLNIYLKNSKQSQLIISIQNSSLLSKRIIKEKKDLVYYVDKEQDKSTYIKESAKSLKKQTLKDISLDEIEDLDNFDLF